MSRALAAALLVVCATISAAAEFPGRFRIEPLIVRLEGRFAADRAQAHAMSRDVVSMQIGDGFRWLAVTSARTISHNSTLSGRAVLDRVAPLHPNFFVAGSQDLRRSLEDAADGVPIELEGLVDGASRTLLLRDVRVGTSNS